MPDPNPPTFVPAIPGMPRNPPKVIAVRDVQSRAVGNGYVIEGVWQVPDRNKHADGIVHPWESFEYVATSGAEVKAFMDSVLPDNISTVHRAKGLEAPRVFLIAPETMPYVPMSKIIAAEKAGAPPPRPHPQERNLQYVALTRALEEFYFVGEPWGACAPLVDR